MASRYSSFARTARNFYASTRNTTRSSSSSHSWNNSNSSSFRSRAAKTVDVSAIERRLCARTMLPLHSAIAASKLVSHLSFSSRSACALPLGLQGYVHTIPLFSARTISCTNFLRCLVIMIASSQS